MTENTPRETKSYEIENQNPIIVESLTSPSSYHARHGLTVGSLRAFML